MGGVSSREKADIVAKDKGYTIVRELGSGAFGTVYLAESDSGAKVAMKMYVAQADANKEAKFLEQLKSPHIVELKRFYTVSTGMFPYTETVHALVMEYCPKGDLGNYLEHHNGPILKEDRLKWYRQLTSGLKYIHGKEIAHRDIKPENILVTAHLDLKLGDVGVAKAAYNLSKPDYSYEQYYMNQFTGTKPYMAPEVYNQHYTLQSDVFSLALVFVMIAEKPDPLEPRADVSKCSFLGKVLCDYERYRSDSPTSLLIGARKNATESENRLFDEMLRYDYKKRLTVHEIEERLSTLFERNSSCCTCGCFMCIVVLLIAIIMALHGMSNVDSK
jgi:serine/threonine protein kinase